MPIIKSAKKRQEVAIRNNERNKARRSALATAIKKFNKAINKAISLKYLGDLNNTKGSHYTYKHIAWLGEQKTFGYAMSKHGTEVDASYIDQFVMLCAKVKTILDKAKEKNVTLPLKNKQNKNMNLD